MTFNYSDELGATEVAFLYYGLERKMNDSHKGINIGTFKEIYKQLEELEKYADASKDVPYELKNTSLTDDDVYCEGDSWSIIKVRQASIPGATHKTALVHIVYDSRKREQQIKLLFDNSRYRDAKIIYVFSTNLQKKISKEIDERGLDIKCVLCGTLE